MPESQTVSAESRRGPSYVDRVAMVPRLESTAWSNTGGVLLVRQRANNEWSLPKGAIEQSDASHADAARREFFEEVGLQLPEEVVVRNVGIAARFSRYRGTSEQVRYFYTDLSPEFLWDALENFSPGDEITDIAACSLARAHVLLKNGADRSALMLASNK